jgi:uncharacterized protein (DUF983 family)
MLHLSEARDSLYFWPILTLSAIAVFFFGWAVQISAENWVGQAIWGALSTIIALVLLAMAVRAWHRTSMNRISARRVVQQAPR